MQSHEPNNEVDAQSDRTRNVISGLLELAQIGLDGEMDVEMDVLATDPKPASVSEMVEDARNTFLSGGRIWAEGAGEGRGNRFTFALPTIDGSEPENVRNPVGFPVGSLGVSVEPAREQRRVLAVDDDPHALMYVRNTLTKAGYAPIVTSDSEEALRLFDSERPDLVVLDVMLPGIDGIELMQRMLIKADVPVIFLSAYGQDQIIAKAFDNGATDYVIKPFSETEFVARIRAALRRQTASRIAIGKLPYTCGDLTINYAERSVSVAGSMVRLTATEYEVLVELALNAGRVMTHQRLLSRVWKPSSSGDARHLRTVVKNLRRKLGDNASSPTYIFTEPRVGYRMPKGDRNEAR